MAPSGTNQRHLQASYLATSSTGPSPAGRKRVAQRTVTVRLAVLETAPESSVTVSVTVKLPACVYEWLSFQPLLVVPSPNSKAYLTIEPSGSLEADASTTTDSGACPLAGAVVNDAIGNTFRTLRMRLCP